MTATDSTDSTDSTEDVVLLEISERIATITLNRPAARNALSSEVLALLAKLMSSADADDEVDVLIITGADPAFSAGLDLKELGSTSGNLGRGGSARDGDTRDTAEGRSGASGQRGPRGPFPPLTKPLIGAINGVAITGGFELALNCDFLIASEQAKFGDTHTRVGVMPGWGLTVLLSQAIGVRRAREMSFTGNFLGAHDALQWGLVNRVVSHADLIPAARQLARDIIGNDQAGVRQIRATYAEINRDQPGWEIESRDSVNWQRTMFSPDKVAERRDSIMNRGRTQ
jgi:enoyl-CoA hydratase